MVYIRWPDATQLKGDRQIDYREAAYEDVAHAIVQAKHDVSLNFDILGIFDDKGKCLVAPDKIEWYDG